MIITNYALPRTKQNFAQQVHKQNVTPPSRSQSQGTSLLIPNFTYNQLQVKNKDVSFTGAPIHLNNLEKKVSLVLKDMKTDEILIFGDDIKKADGYIGAFANGLLNTVNFIEDKSLNGVFLVQKGKEFLGQKLESGLVLVTNLMDTNVLVNDILPIGKEDSIIAGSVGKFSFDDKFINIDPNPIIDKVSDTVKGIKTYDVSTDVINEAAMVKRSLNKFRFKNLINNLEQSKPAPLLIEQKSDVVDTAVSSAQNTVKKVVISDNPLTNVISFVKDHLTNTPFYENVQKSADSVNQSVKSPLEYGKLLLDKGNAEQAEHYLSANVLDVTNNISPESNNNIKHLSELRETYSLLGDSYAKQGKSIAAEDSYNNVLKLNFALDKPKNISVIDDEIKYLKKNKDSYPNNQIIELSEKKSAIIQDSRAVQSYYDDTYSKLQTLYLDEWSKSSGNDKKQWENKLKGLSHLKALSIK